MDWLFSKTLALELRDLHATHIQDAEDASAAWRLIAAIGLDAMRGS